MNLSDYFFILKRKIINKRNIIFIIILSILVTIILLCISIMYFVNSTYNMLINDIDNRTLIISKPATEEEYQHIEDIKHVLLVTSNKYSDGLSVDVKEFKYDGKEGIVTLEPLLIPADLEIKEGKSITNELEVVCHSHFNPFFNQFNYTPVNNFFYKDKEIIGKEFNVQSRNTKDVYSFKIVGTFISHNLSTIDTCYMSINDFDKIKSNIAALSGDTPIYYNDLMVVVDDVTNLETVKQKLTNLGYFPFSAYTLDDSYKYMVTIPLFICLIISIITFNILYNFLNKKIKYQVKSLGLLKCVGYKNKVIFKYEVLENLILLIISIIISFIISFISFLIMNNVFLLEYKQVTLSIHLPYIYVLFFLIGLILLVIFLTYYFLKKIFNFSIQELLND